MKRKGVRTVEDFMSTAVITMKETDTMSGVDLEMKFAEIRHVPVVDGRNHVIGVLSDRDVLRALLKAEGKPLLIGAVMTRHVRTVRPATPAHQAAATMVEQRFGCLPVVDDDEHLVGIITETDFLIIAEQALSGHDVSRGHEH